jgi:8-amino-7-oxononanoate synthase
VRVPPAPTLSPAGARDAAPPAGPPPALDAQLRAELLAIDAAGLRRRLRAVERIGGARVRVDGREAIDFASNDYLGLAADPRPARAAADALARAGTGAAAARLIAGGHPLHAALEARLAALKGAERALLFPSGYAANVGALPALAGADDAVYSDALNHASLIDGCRLARAAVHVFPHGDVAALDALLARDAGRYRRSWVVVEGVYSMDGDRFPLDALVAVARRRGAHTFVDDAHATGVLGARGGGSAEHWGVAGAIDVTVGTLGKALGAAGAFVAGSAPLVEVLLHRARSFVFTTASPPALAAATLAALDVLDAEPWRRARLRAVATSIRAGLRARGLAVPGPDDAHVIPVVLGDARRAAAVGEALARDGLLVGAIRPPTVPAGSARLRVSASAAHSDDDVARLVHAVAAAAERHA